MQYVDKFGKFVSRDEATLNGTLKDGYTVRVPMMLADSGPRINLVDAEQAFADSEVGRAVVARARMVHELTTRTCDALPFTPADEARAVRQAMADARAADTPIQSKRDADRSQAIRDAARAAYLDHLANPLR